MAGKLSWDVTATQFNSALHPSGVAKSSTSFGWGNGGKVSAAGWQVTLCDPIWHVISRSGEVISITNCYIRVYFTLLYNTLQCSVIVLDQCEVNLNISNIKQFIKVTLQQLHDCTLICNMLKYKDSA